MDKLTDNDDEMLEIVKIEDTSDTRTLVADLDDMIASLRQFSVLLSPTAFINPKKPLKTYPPSSNLVKRTTKPSGINSSNVDINEQSVIINKVSTNTLVTSSPNSTWPSQTIVPDNFTKSVPSLTITAPLANPQKIQASDIQPQLMLPAHLYKLAQKGQNKAVRYPGKINSNIRLNPKGFAAASVTKAPHPTNLIKTFNSADSSIVSPIMKATDFQRSTSNKTITLTRMISPVKQKTQPSISTASTGRLLNSITGAVAKNVVNKFQTLGWAQYAKNQKRRQPLNVIDSPHSFGVPRKCVQIHHNFKYEDGQLYQNIPSPLDIIPATPFSAPVSEGVRRQCKCTKSLCLKLYCVCFASGEFCRPNCKCNNCFNNLENEEHREKTIQMCLERNPMAFKPKIGQIKDQTDALRGHKKGCNCKRSGCLKNYCECHVAKVACSENCKCTDCRNKEDSAGNVIGEANSSNSSIAGPSTSGTIAGEASAAGLSLSDQELTSFQQHDDLDSPTSYARWPCNLLTPDVIDATIQCTIAQAAECQKNNLDKRNAERLILEEFGRCLVEIIEFSLNTDN